MTNDYRTTLLRIGSQTPAWAKDPHDHLVRIFNTVTAIAREAVGAQGQGEHEKADWCSDQLTRHRATPVLDEELVDKYEKLQADYNLLCRKSRHGCVDATCSECDKPNRGDS